MENVLKVMSEVYNSIPILCTVNDIVPHSLFGLTQHIHTKTISVEGEYLFE
jgi:hypothetical protein